MKYLRTAFLGIALLFSFYVSGQDIHFSQFNTSPLNLNPALTGAINGKARVIANYRNQWPQILQDDSYRTYALSYDRRQNLKSGDYFGVGASFFGDVGGSTRFGTIQVNLSLSFAKTISKSGSVSHTIIGGLQSGIAQRKIDVNTLRWPSSVDNDGIAVYYNPFGSLDQTDFLYYSIDAGLLWVSKFGERKSFLAGVSAFHVNEPNVSFQINSDQPLSIRTSIHAGAELPLSSRLTLLPSIMYLTQGIHAQLNIGTMLSTSILADSLFSNFQGGIYYRAGRDLAGRIHSDAIITVLSAQVQGIQLSFSYDFTISDLNYDNVGGMEVSVGYVFGANNKKVKPFEVPQF